MLEYRVLKIIHHVGTRNATICPTIIFDNSELILCDTGLPNQIELIENELHKFDYCVEDITKIIITHHDYDHYGSLRALKNKNSSIEIISSEIEAQYISGKTKSLRLLQAEQYNKTLNGSELEAGMQFCDYLKTIENCAIDRFVIDGEIIVPGLKTIFTPGHTPGHISLFLEENFVFIAGDALTIDDSKLQIANPKFTLNPKQAKESIKKIIDLEPEKIICYHGGSTSYDIRNSLINIL